MTTDDFLNAWLLHDGDPTAVMARLDITPTRLLDLVAEHRAALDTLHDLRIRRAQAHALEHQLAAADQLRRVLARTTDLTQRRHAATTLGRIAHQIQRTPLLQSRGAQAPGAPLPIPPQLATHPTPPASSIPTPSSTAPSPTITTRPITPRPHAPAAALTQAAGAQRARAG